MDNGTIVLEILRNLSDDDIYTLIDVFENHNDDEECMKKFNDVVNKIQNAVNKLDSNFLTNFKNKETLAYFMYDVAMDYHSNDLTQEKINKDLDFFRKNKMSESTNKYVLAFREACEKLEEDDGNPSVTQVIDYDVDNEEVDYWNSGLKEISDTLMKVKHDLADITWNKYKHNKKLNKALDKLEDLIYYLFNEFADKSPTNNEYVGSGFVDGLSSDDYTTWDVANVDHARYK